MDPKTSRIVTTVVLIVAFVFLIDPFDWFGAEGRAYQSAPSRETREVLDDIRANRLRPHPEVIAEAFDIGDVVLIGDTPYVSEPVRIVTEAAAVLPPAGVGILATDLLLAEDQQEIDSLVSAESFDREAAQQLLFDRLVIWGYREYVDLLEEVWRVNREVGDLRVVGLAIRQDFSAIETEEDIEDAEKIAQVLAGGVPEREMYETMAREVLDPGRQALVFVRREQSFTQFEQLGFAENMAEYGFSGVKRLGRAIYDRIGDRAVHLVVHVPWPDTRGKTGLGYPLDGLFEDMVASLPDEERRVGVLLRDSPLAELPVRSGEYVYEAEVVPTVGDFCDGYLLTAPLKEVSLVTPIEGFITEENLAEARRGFPGPNIGEVTADELNEYIAGMPANVARALEEFR